MLSNSRRRAFPPPPIRIPEIKQRRDGEEELQPPTPPITPAPPTSPLSKANPAVGPFPTQQSTSLRPSSPTPQITLVAKTTTRLSTPTTTTTSRSPTKTSFVTVVQTQSVLSPEEKGETTPGHTSTVFVSVTGAPQVVTVTAKPTGSTGTTLPSADAAQNGKGGANLLPRGAVIPLISLGIIAGLSAIITVVVVLWRRRKKKSDEKVRGKQPAMTEEGDGGFRAIPDTRPMI